MCACAGMHESIRQCKLRCTHAHTLSRDIRRETRVCTCTRRRTCTHARVTFTHVSDSSDAKSSIYHLFYPSQSLAFRHGHATAVHAFHPKCSRKQQHAHRLVLIRHTLTHLRVHTHTHTQFPRREGKFRLLDSARGQRL